MCKSCICATHQKRVRESLKRARDEEGPKDVCVYIIISFICMAQLHTVCKLPAGAGCCPLSLLEVPRSALLASSPDCQLPPQPSAHSLDHLGCVMVSVVDEKMMP